MRIKKIGQSTPVTGQIIDSLNGNSTTNAPSIRAVNEALSYSTSEKKIGTWIDGKPVYRRVLEFNSPMVNTYIAHGISNLKRVINFNGAVNISTDFKPLNVVYQASDAVNPRFCFSVYSFAGDSVLFSGGGFYVDNRDKLKVTLIVEYTKTTD